MEQKKSDKEVARLLKRWAMDVANRLRWREAFSASEAVRQAYLVQNCLEALGAGKVKLTYMKKNGEIREAVGTLCKGISAAYDNYEYKGSGGVRKTEDGFFTFAYWDLDEEGFRSFNAARLDDYLVTQKEDFNKVTQKSQQEEK